MGKRLFLALLAALLTMGMQAQKEYFDAKSVIVGLTTTDDIYGYHTGKTFDNYIEVSLPYITQNEKIVPEDTRQELLQIGIGKKILDLLFERNKGMLSEDLLRKRAWENKQLTDVERAQYGVYSPELILKEDILPVLENNYILITDDIYKEKKGGKKLVKKAWIVFHVDIDQNTWDQVNANWNNLSGYDAIKVGLTYLASGKCKPNQLTRKISKAVPALAIRGQIISSSPYCALIENASIDWGERMDIYTQKQNSKGEIKSKRIGRTRTRIKNGEANQVFLYPIAGVKGSQKNGDQAVWSPVTDFGHSFVYQQQSYSQSLRYTIEDRFYDFGSFFTSFDIDFRVGWLKDHSKALYTTDNGGILRSPVFGTVGVGSTYAWRLVKGVGLEFYWLIQGKLWFLDYEQDPVPTDPKDTKPSPFGADLCFPLGLRASLNLHYPLHLIGGVEWAPTILGSGIVKDDILGIRGWKRSEPSVFVGLRYAF